MQGLKELVSPSARIENGDEKEMRLIKYFRGARTLQDFALVFSLSWCALS